MGNQSVTILSAEEAESRFTERELSTLTSGFSRLCRGSSTAGPDWVDESTFQYFLLSEFPEMPPHLASRLFNCWDADSNSQLNLREFVIGICICARGKIEERLKLLFKLYDINNSGMITKDTLLRFDELIRETSSYKDEDHWTGLAMVEEAFSTIHRPGGGKVSKYELEFPDFRNWGYKFINSPLLCWISQLGLKLVSTASLGGYDKVYYAKPDHFSYSVNKSKDVSSEETSYGTSFLAPAKPPLDIPKKPATGVPLDDNDNDNDIDTDVSTSNSKNRYDRAALNEAEVYRKLYVAPSNKNLVVGDVWYVVSKDWLDAWKLYVGIEDGKVNSIASRTTKRPGRIQNSHLVEVLCPGTHSPDKQALLKQDIFYGHDYLIINEPIWEKFYEWYGGEPIISRKVIQSYTGSNGIREPELELYPVKLIVRCLCDGIQITEGREMLVSKADKLADIEQMAINLFFYSSSHDNDKDKDKNKDNDDEIRNRFQCVQLWKVLTEREDLISAGEISENKCFHLLEDLGQTVEEVNIGSGSSQLIILQVFVQHQHGSLGPECNGNSDMKKTKYLQSINLKSSGPEEPAVLCGGQNKDDSGTEKVVTTQDDWGLIKQTYHDRGRLVSMRSSVESQPVQGIKGLQNLGNTCFMNAALQCLVHTHLLAYYFLSGSYLNDVNTRAKDGTQGQLADAFGDLMRVMWKIEGVKSGNFPISVAPRRLKEAIGAFESKFVGMEQQDAQELLSSLLHGLAEDLNRVHEKPYVELADSDGRPDQEVAREWWCNHVRRELCIITALFTGQFKSLLQCTRCDFDSARFEPFVYLSLSLPESAFRVVTVVIMWHNTVELPLVCSVRVPKIGNLRDVKREILKLQPGINGGNTLGTAWLKPNGLIRILKSQASSSRLGCDSDRDNLRLAECEIVFAQINDRSIVQIFESEDDRPLSGIREGVPLYLFQLPTCTGSGSKIQGYDGNNHRECRKDKLNIRFGIGSRVRYGRGKDEIFGVIVEVHGNKTQTDNQSSPHFKRARFQLDLLEYSVRFQVTGRNGTHFHIRNMKRQDLRCLAPDFITVKITQRQWQHQTTYFFNPLRPVHVGMPFILRVVSECNTTRDLYILVSKKLGKAVDMDKTLDSLLKVKEPQDHILESNSSSRKNTLYQDCDSQVTTEWGFKLVLVTKAGGLCPRCPWIKSCFGCTIVPSDSLLSVQGLEANCCIAIDWGVAMSKNEATWASCGPAQAVVHRSYETECNIGTKPLPLEVLMENFTKKEELNGVDQVYCSKCKSFGNHMKQIELWRAPPILVIHLKRFQHTSYRRQKMQNLITYPLTDFDLSNYLTDESDTNESNTPKGKGNKTNIEFSITKERELDAYINEILDGEYIGLRAYGGKRHGDIDKSYNLYSVVEHTGSMGAGHYVALVRRHIDKKWYCFDDEHVHEVDESRVLSKNAYVLFYVRKDVENMETLQSLFPCEPVPQKEFESRLKQLDSEEGTLSDRCNLQ